MHITDHARDRPTGTLSIQVFRDGVCVEEVGLNLVVDLSKQIQSRLLGGDSGWDVTKIAVGTSGTPTAPGDSALAGAFVKAIDKVEYPSDTSVVFFFSLAKEEANGMAIREFGLLADNGTLFARKVRATGAALEKDAELSIRGTWKIQF